MAMFARIAIVGLLLAPTQVVLAQQQEPIGLTNLEEITIQGQPYNLVIFSNPALSVPWFNSAIREHGVVGDITSCHMLIDLPVGVVHGNHSYGGDCVLHTTAGNAMVTIYNDVLVGHFRLVPATQDALPKEALAAFVAANCFGG
jgi:hypothetical protein